MKKDILDNVYYRLKDEHEVKLSILYCIKYAGFPVSDTEIKHFMLSATSVSFVDLCENLASLVKDNFLKVVWRDDIEKYDLTSPGAELIEMFTDKILLTVRENLRDSIDEYFNRNAMDLQIDAKLMPALGENFNVTLTIKNAKEMLMNLTIMGGKRENAIAMRKHLEKNATDVFAKILDMASDFKLNEEE